MGYMRYGSGNKIYITLNIARNTFKLAAFKSAASSTIFKFMKYFWDAINMLLSQVGEILTNPQSIRTYVVFAGKLPFCKWCDVNNDHGLYLITKRRVC